MFRQTKSKARKIAFSQHLQHGIREIVNRIEIKLGESEQEVHDIRFMQSEGSEL